MADNGLDSLNLTGDEKDLVEPGPQNAEVLEVTEKQTKGGGKLPQGTPMLNVRFRILDGQYAKRNFFKTYVIPPQKIGNKPYEHYNMMISQVVDFLKAVGYSKDEIKDGVYKDFDTFRGRQCTIVIGTQSSEEYGDQSVVKSVRPPSGELAGSGTSNLP